jgi:large subunit ribosomal protein L30|tara:strand:- start:91 stop:552 length:462 start_codon:yes stop_codon:yes gene_type:complete
MKLLAVVRLRGTVGVRRSVKDTMQMLRLNRTNHCILLKNTQSSLGMLAKVKDYVTWGEINHESAEEILRNRGELEGGRSLTDDFMKNNTEYKNIKSFAKELVEGKAALSDVPKLKQFFRLHPPRKGFGGIKKSVQEGGGLGRRDINTLIYRMR